MVHISLRSFAVVILALLASCSAVEDEQTCRPRLEMIRELKWAMDSLLLDWEGTSSLRSCSQSWMSARHLNGPHVPSPFLFQTYYKCILYHSVHGIKASSYLYSVTSITGRKHRFLCRGQFHGASISKQRVVTGSDCTNRVTNRDSTRQALAHGYRIQC